MSRTQRVGRWLVPLLLVTLSTVAGGTTARAVPGDGASGTYSKGSSANTYNATIKNTGSHNHLYDYIQVPSGFTVT
jgi:hypothetical protein